MIILDSNVWIAYFHEQDSQHTKAEKVFSQISTPIILPEYVILEVSTILVQHAGKKIANQFLELIKDNRDIILLLTEEAFFLKVIAAFQKENTKKLSFVDTALFVLSQKFAVITFDTALSRAIKNFNL